MEEKRGQESLGCDVDAKKWQTLTDRKWKAMDLNYMDELQGQIITSSDMETCDLVVRKNANRISSVHDTDQTAVFRLCFVTINFGAMIAQSV
jgi:hypothetical protein